MPLSSAGNVLPLQFWFNFVHLIMKKSDIVPLSRSYRAYWIWVIFVKLYFNKFYVLILAASFASLYFIPLIKWNEHFLVLSLLSKHWDKKIKFTLQLEFWHCWTNQHPSWRSSRWRSSWRHTLQLTTVGSPFSTCFGLKSRKPFLGNTSSFCSYKLVKVHVALCYFVTSAQHLTFNYFEAFCLECLA